ncbi:hypothetical protein GCM10010967_32070 [Dyadobacter beijingensis]|uniref:Lanthionine synthetase-like protein n=2 Tax=Dyadobacter beijingensis TaxID=365489 RepID=A0ABQ2I2A6_9BACT|nr:hypothetical protein GCM10010967_32070 [Dyadobacter beijingensis]
MIAAAKIDEIHEVINIYRRQLTSFSLSEGYLGVSVFKYLYAVHTGRKRYLDEAREAFDHACDMIDGDPRKAYPQDFTDLGSVAQYLCQAGVLDIDPNVFLSDVDSILLSKMRAELSAGNIGSLTSGALGYGLYFLQRSYYNRERAQPVVEELVLGIIRSAVRTDGTCHWNAGLDHDEAGSGLFFPQGEAAILLILSRVVEMGLFPATHLEALTQEAIAYIENRHLEQKALSETDKNYGVYLNRQASRYEDISLGYTLLRTGTAFKNAEWSKEGRAILKNCASRHLIDPTGVQNAGILSGATGLALLFDRAAHLTNDVAMEHAANFWYTQILRFDLNADGYAGYKVLENPWSPQSNIAFSEGIIGIGCGLIKSLNPGKVDFHDLIWLL